MSLLVLAFVGCLSAPAYLTGEPAEDAIKHLQGVSDELVEAHEEAAKYGIIVGTLTTLIALGMLYASRKSERMLKKLMPIALLASLFTTAVMARVAHEGGKIRHPEILGESAP